MAEDFDSGCLPEWLPKNYTTVMFDNVGAWIEAIELAAAKHGEVRSCDDPGWRTFGFFVGGRRYATDLPTLKAQQRQLPGWMRSLIQTPAGREEIAKRLMEQTKDEP